MTNPVTRYRLTWCERVDPHEDGEWVKYDDIKHLLKPDEPVASREQRLEELAHHLRHCRTCGELDVKECAVGGDLWDRAMPESSPNRSEKSHGA